MTARTWGAGIPPLLFLHGYGCSAEDWSPVLHDLSPDRLWQVPDLPGHGRSSDPTPRSFAQLVQYVRDELIAPIGQPPVIVGHSMGGMLGLAVAESDEDLLAGLILVDAFPHLASVAETFGGPDDDADPYGYGAVMDRRTPLAVQARIRTALAAGAERAGENLFRSLLDTDLRSGLGRVRIRTSLLLGDRRFLTRAHLPSCLERLGYGGLHGLQTQLAPSHHFVMLECPGLVAGHIRDFCSGLRSGNTASSAIS